MTDYLVETVDALTKAGGSYGLDQQEVARAFVTTFGHEVRWVQAEKRWYVAARDEGARFWGPEVREEVMARQEAVIRALSANEPKADRKRMRSATFARGSLDFVKPSVAVAPEEFNTDPLLLGVLNGVVDLRTGVVRGVEPEDMLTQRCATRFVPEVECPRWLDHLRVLTRKDAEVESPGDPELIAYVQELIGLSLIGSQAEHCFVLLRGDGRNGKGVLVDTLGKILGDYADVLDDMVLYQDAGSHTTGLVDLRGRRFVSKDELDGRRQLNTALLKHLTGGGRIKARRMRQDNIRWEMTHSLWLVSNFQPNFGVDSSSGLWDRALIIETGPTIPKAQRRSDVDVRAELEAEAPGILLWAVEGAVRYLDRGRLPDTPVRVQMATEVFQQSARLMRAFLDDRGETVRGEHTLLRDVRSAFGDWLEAEGIKTRENLTSSLVGQLLRQEGIKVDRGSFNKTYAFDLHIKSVMAEV